MNRHSILIKNTFLYSAGPLLNKIVAVILIPWYSYLLTTSELGYYDLVVTTTNLVIAIVTLKISDAVYRWLIDSAGDSKKQIAAISNSLVIIISGVLFMAVFFAILPSRFNLQYKSFVSAYIITFILFNYLQQVLRGLGYVKTYSWSAIVNCLLLILFNVVFVWMLKYKLSGVLLSVISANILSIIITIFAVRIFKYLRVSAVNKTEMAGMAKYTTPLIFNAINWWLMGGFDRYIIVSFLGLKFNGIYAIANKYAAILILLNSFFIPAWQDFILTKKVTSGKKPDFNKFFNSYIILQMSMVIFLIASSKFVMELFIDAKFIAALNYMPLLILGSAFLALTSFLGAFFLLEKNTSIIFKTTLAGCIVNVVICFVLIRPIGLYGCATGMLSGFMVTFFARYYFLKRTIGLRINIYPVIVLGLFLVIVTGTVYAGSDSMILLAALVSIVILLVMNRKIWMATTKYIIGKIRPAAVSDI